ncbi:sphingosine N-acyltransferase lag1 [Yamadazyma tenuis]|uniref:Longevity assurance proteins LAG1/LAC1 n=1 Tax=Candida tenuis (strain ATCC 10573 / BCRC 21748 / CBS 615 / JCM 9827 / NBRC 10315 / NRRL Y-1498 / VKM Y-70) TaxID=590646 RepID=G3B080_CANTC|nr:longevity assurance proteins LAG1/LAC1 [Yamadazyma tenuis ATCC 10573]XP_006685194.1 uncharacterized protein CANTEDRAFT_113057 [Yamadazyma tenuis ATCC 10573]EGV65507.1 longevity assurance proteins LAG1/LAC1 [Yamadazyma tenuis ATCC 10573]EGV65508.1 hypothetical protein CANTEDRAFT_113057 [Yamadazyma tenuis ATCC 10573]WEJ95003.1 sphingosine N-acyltransferase lag1 [Yamadazyma tenuis]
MTSSNLAPPNSNQVHRRRGSSIGNIDLGDTSPALSTMKTSKAQRRKSSDRMAQLSEKTTTDSQLLRKFYLSYRELTYRQTWIQPLIVLVLSVFIYLISNPEGQIHQFLEVCILPSYKIPGTDQYGKGKYDFYFVFYYAIFFTFFREFCMCMILRPLAHYFKITKESRVKRFMEQTYAIIYFGAAGCFGLWIMSKLPLRWFQTTPLYETYPHKTHDFWFKIFYLGQAAFWVQQSVILVLGLEARRSDFVEFVFHHIITIALIWNSYRFHFTWMGLTIFVCMDISDFFLGMSKTLNYLNAPGGEAFFVFFVFVWIYLRHYINLKVLWSVLTEFRTVGQWELNWETQQYKCWISQPIVFFLIAALQLVNIYWLFLILRILYRYINVGEAKDERSDDEDEADDEADDEEDRSEKKNQ